MEIGWLFCPGTGEEQSKEPYIHNIHRIISNAWIKPSSIMKGFIPQSAEMRLDQKQALILMLDQSKIWDGFECLMVSLRLRERPIPVLCQVLRSKTCL